jgi:hypothetical protein
LAHGLDNGPAPRVDFNVGDQRTIQAGENDAAGLQFPLPSQRMLDQNDEASTTAAAASKTHVGFQFMAVS